MPADEREKLAALADRFTISELFALVERSAAVAPGFRGQFGGRVALEVFLMSATKLGAETSVSAILEKLVSLEERLRSAPSEAVDEEANEGVPPAPSARPGAAAPVARGALGGQWEKLLEAVAQESMTVSSFLGQAQPVGIENNKLVVQFSSEQALYVETVQKPAARELIENKIQEVFGKKLALRIRLVEHGPSDESTSADVAEDVLQETETSREEQPPEQAEDVVSSPQGDERLSSTSASVRDDEKVKMVLGLFNGEIVRIEKNRSR